MLKAAVIGMGRMGQRHHRVLSRMPSIGLVAVCDPRPISGFQKKTYSHVDQLLANEKPDFAVVATPASGHENIALRCMEEGVDLLIEKPVASTAQAGKKILENAIEKQIKVAVGHIERFNPVVTALIRDLKDKEIYTIHITRVSPYPEHVTDVGILHDLSVHDIDLIRLISGKNIKEMNIFKSRKINKNNEDCANLSFLLENDILAQITTNWLTPFRKRLIEVSTKDTYYEANLITQTLCKYSEGAGVGVCEIRGSHVCVGEPLCLELEAFVKFLKTGVQETLASVEDSIATLEVLEVLAAGPK